MGVKIVAQQMACFWKEKKKKKKKKKKRVFFFLCFSLVLSFSSLSLSQNCANSLSQK